MTKVFPKFQVPEGNVTECSAAAQALKFRQEEDGFVSLSFGTISSSGPTAAIIHYRYSILYCLILGDFLISRHEQVIEIFWCILIVVVSFILKSY